MFLVIEALLFGLFTMCMMGDQATTVFTNQTQIDRLKNFKHMVEVEVNEVFGSPINQRFSVGWLWPIAVTFEGVLKDAILGYRLENKDEIETAPLLANENNTSVGNSGVASSPGNGMVSLNNDNSGRSGKSRRKVSHLC
jgi:hypothetical protein